MGFKQVELTKSTIPGGVVNIGECGLFINVSNYLNLKQQVNPYTAFSGSFQSKPMGAYAANVPMKLFQNSLGLEYRVTPTEAFSQDSDGWRAYCRHSIYVNGTERLHMDITTYYTGGTSSDVVNSFMAVFYNDSDQKYYACLPALFKDGSITQRFYPNNFIDVTANMAGQIITSYDPYSTDDNHTPAGGYGEFDYSSDDDLPPALPSVSAAQVGFVSLWNPSAQEMKDLADYLWTGTFDWTNFRKLFTDPMQCVLSVGIIPVTPTTGTSKEIIFGGSSHSGVNAKPITDQFVDVDLGSVHISGQTASYMDYSPYCKASIFLPYCGTYALDVDDIMDADVDLEYHIDIYTGACVAYLTITRQNSDGSTLHSTLYQFTGNVLATIPVTSADHSAFIQSLLFMGAGIAATVATSGAAAPEIGGAMAAGDAVSMSPALTGIAAGSAINTVMSMKPNVLRSGNLSSTAGLLGKQKPCITLTWSNLCRPDDENKMVGMPEYKSGTLSDFSGFTVVSAVHMNNILCTDAELKMIESALYKGVIV